MYINLKNQMFGELIINNNNNNNVFSIFYDDVITPNLGYYRTDMTISSTALNQSKLLNYFQ